MSRSLYIALLVCAAGAMLLGSQAHANWLGSLRGKLAEPEFDISIVDEQGAPLPGAIVLAGDLGSGKPRDWHGCLSRFLQRHGGELDYVRALAVNPIGLFVRYADENGVLTWGAQKGNSNGVYAMIVAKRGYEPLLIQASRVELRGARGKLVLRRKAGESVDPRMEEFDRLRGQVFASSRRLGQMTAERESFLAGARQRMHKLGVDLEKDRPDLAARIYVNLADLPAVSILRSANGEIIGRGFRNSYSAEDAERRAYMVRAFDLDRGTPQLAAQRILDQQLIDRPLSMPEPLRTSRLRADVSAIRQMAEHTPERLWPHVYYWMASRLNSLRDYAEACKAMKAAFNFEPETQDEEGWRQVFSGISQALPAGQQCEPPR